MTTNDTTNTGTPPRGLVAQAITAARQHRTTDPASFYTRHTDPDRWTRRNTTARTIATAFAVPVDAVLVTDDPARRYGTDGHPGELITVTDPHSDTGQQWRFVPDFAGAWLLLGPCPTCGQDVPHVRVADLVDLGAWFDPDYPDNAGPPPEFAFDPGHRSTCPFSAANRAKGHIALPTVHPDTTARH